MIDSTPCTLAGAGATEPRPLSGENTPMTTDRQLSETGRPSPSPTGIEHGSLPAILRAITNLSEDDYRQLKAWLVEHDWDRWDKEIERDSESGALDFLANGHPERSRRV